MKHIIITPVYNEEKFLDDFLESIINQTKLPEVLILVDDNSDDNSAKIIKKFTKNFCWIKYVYHSSSASKSQGKKVINAFNYGLNYCDLNNIDFISKIDADLQFHPSYFEKIGEAFLEDTKLGITGGTIKEFVDGSWKEISQASYHIRGALKSYRTKCFLDIKGLKSVLGWDGLDEMTALYLGWQTRVLDQGVKHFRPAATDYNKKDLNFKLGYANYQNGGNLFLALIRACVKFKQKPFLIVGISFLRGYLNAKKAKAGKNVDRDLSIFINSFHLKRLLKLKRY
jgi:glycosyltransferase involved in cell wall biosynthesis